MNQFARLVGIALLIPTIALADLEDGDSIQQSITPNTGDFIELFPGRDFFPGQIVSIQVGGGPIDVNHRFWEDRECNWLGLHCWYEKRDAPNPYRTDMFPLVVRALKRAGKEPPDRPPQSEAPRFLLSRDVVVATTPAVPQTIIAEIDVAGADADLSVFGGAVQLFGKIADKGANGVQINRDPCVSRNTCSGGLFTASVVNVDNAPRFEKLKTLLGKNPPLPTAVIRVLQADRLLVRDPKVRQRLAEFLFKHAQQRYQTQKTSPEYIAALEYAATLDKNQGSGALGNALAEAYLGSGNFAAAKVRAGGDLRALQVEFEKDPENETARKAYIDSIQINARVLVGERGALYSSDLVKAVALYRKAAELALSAARNTKASAETRRDFYSEAYGSAVEASKVLMMARTEENLLQAKALVDWALELAQESTK